MQGFPPAGLKEHERKVFSQHGEDGILEWLIPRAKCKLIVEIGCGGGKENQSTNLVENHGWTAIQLDKKLGSFITAENVNEYVQFVMGVLSIDIDGNDYWIWKAIKAQGDIVCIEYNSWLPDPFVIPYDPNFVWRGSSTADGNWFYGASLGALYKLGATRGYQLVGCDSSGVNAFFIKRELGLGLPNLSPEEAFIQKRKHMFGKVDPGMLVEV